MTDTTEWFDDLDGEDLDELHHLVAQAEGCLAKALTIMQGRGADHHDALAHSYETVSYERLALDAARDVVPDTEPANPPHVDARGGVEPGKTTTQDADSGGVES